MSRENIHTHSIAGTRKAEILLVGTELLIGRTRDANAYWLGKQIGSFGVPVTRVTIVRDDVEEIASAIKEIVARKPDYVFSSGGLGPTFDDVTLQGIADATGKNLVLDEKAFGWLKERYEKLAKPGAPSPQAPALNESRKKMAYIPEGSTALHNSAGAAPGVLVLSGQTRLFVLPGVPRELQAIFIEEIAPVLQRESGGIAFHEVSFRLDGVGESTMAERINSLMKEIDGRVWIKSHAKHDGKSYYVEMQISGYGDAGFLAVVEGVAARVNRILLDLGGRISALAGQEK
ncbi:MAG: competence damage-inducible protein A [Candidatus Lokiarchaeota archaeon]|nr:competence damage-inducible protein A [Candidatus Lokiarchaeota archaeon]